MIVSGITVANNTAANVGGFGNMGVLTVYDSVVRDNVATHIGGGISNVNKLFLYGTTISFA